MFKDRGTRSSGGRIKMYVQYYNNKLYKLIIIKYCTSFMFNFGKADLCNECEWIVPGTIQED